MSTVRTAARGLRWLPVALLVLAPAWLLATESGLWFTLRVAERLSGGRLSVAESAGRLSETFTVRGLSWTTERVTVGIGEASLNLRLTRLLLSRVQAETLKVQALHVAIRGGLDDGEPDEPLTVRAPLRMAVEQGVLRDFRLRRDSADEWVLPEVRFTARWRDEWIVLGELAAVTAEAGPVALHGRLAIIDGRLRFEDFELQNERAMARIEGALGLGQAESELKIAWTRLRPPGADWLASAQGQAELAGPWRDYRWRLRARLDAAGTAGALEARGRGSLDGVVLEASELQALSGRVQAEGRLDWRGGLRTEAAIRWQGLNPAERFPQWPGLLTGAGKFRGDWREPAAKLEFTASLSDSQLRGYPLTLQATGVTEQEQVWLREFRLQSGVSTLTADGQLLPQFALTAKLDSSELQSLWAGLTGSAQLQARLRGTAAAPQLQLAGAAADLEYRGLRAARVLLNGRLAPAARSNLKLELLDVDALLPLRSVVLTASGNARSHRARVEARGETASGGFELTGRLGDAAWRGRLVDALFVPDPERRFALTDSAALAFAAGRFSVEPLCLAGGDSRGCLQGSVSAERQYFALRSERFELKHLQALLPEQWSITGTLSGTASATVRRGELYDLRADLAGSAGSVAGGGLTLAYGPGSFRVQPDGKTLLAQLRLTPAGGAVHADLKLSPAATLLDRGVQGELRLDLPDLSWLPVLSPEIAAAQGTLRGTLAAAGTLRSPSLDGRLALAGGRVQLTTPGIEFTEIAASFESRGGQALALTVDARAGEGALKLEGALSALRPQLVGTFKLTGDNAQLFNTAELRAWVAPDLTLTLAAGAARLGGTLTVTGALITPRELGGDGIGPSVDQVFVSSADTQGRGGFGFESEVRIVLGEAVRFDGLGLKTRLTGAITTYGDPGRPTRARGEFQLVGGRYKAYGQELLIESGRLIFTGGPVTDPAIDITAYREPRDDIRVELHARGTLDAPQFNLTSVPAMAQEEQLAWLVLGRSLSESLEGGGGAELAGAAYSLGLTGGNFLAQNLGGRLGFDEVSVGAKPGETAEKARFTIGKYLSPKLFVSYGVGLFQPGNYFRLQYDLGRGFKLSGESGVTSGGDLLYTIER